MVKSTSTNYLMGTSLFMAPEIFRQNGDLDSYREPVDVWACGVMMYQLLTNRYPFVSENEDQLAEDIMNDPVNFGTPILK